MIKRVLQTLAPGLVRSWRAFLARRSEQRIHRVSSRYVGLYGTRILQGPFGGMDYTLHASGSQFVPKLLGTYEAELLPAITEIIARRPPVLIDIGCAEGYYAVGFAYRCPETFVYAFDINPEARALCQNLARRNQVQDRIAIADVCTTDSLNALPLDGATVICDCEGYELDLLNPTLVPSLATCDILVELHTFLNAEITATIVSRFSRTHDVSLVDSVDRNPDGIPALWFLKRHADRLAAVHEKRVPMQWAWMRSLSARQSQECMRTTRDLWASDTNVVRAGLKPKL